ncbi:hypothetical protein [Desulfuromonas sp. TF]|uniref:hypothetical protein n=1 Tax=Desulfuromonas sp. TF TaxID=1232410 RepID=UPI0004103CCD|nr:hypothetical protein [Desulfuromonas sp. TF]
MKKVFIFTALVLVTLFGFGCGSRGGSSNDTASETPDTPNTPTVSAESLDITTNSYVLETNGADSATLTIITRDKNNAAVGDITVDLVASAGLLAKSQVVTDSDTGIATVNFSPGPETANQVLTITATAGSLEKTLPITLIGTTLSLTSSKSSLLAGAGDTAVITVTAKNANDLAIPNKQVTLSSLLGNTLNSGGVFGSTINVTTNTNGVATATLTATSGAGVETITANGLGAQTSSSINITSAQFGFTSPADGSIIALGASTELIATWTDASGVPKSGETLTFTTTGGYFDNIIGKIATTVLTDGSGQAIVSFSAGSTATPADITVTSGVESDTLRLQRAATNPSQLSLQASPSILSPSVGDVDSSSTITATVRDFTGQAVANETVVFSLVAGPGGGETLSPGTAVTGAGGTASITFTSGSSVSAQDGVIIRASLLSNPNIYADTTLTIGKQAASVIIGSTNKIAKVSVNGLEIGYALPFSVLVVDNNGNPIQNATVDLGIYPLYFYTGLYDVSVTGKFKNEDTNRNGLLDPGEDGAKGWSDWEALPTDTTNIYWYDGSEDAQADIRTSAPTAITPANGKLDPSGVVTIPNNVVTDEDGLAAFQIKYAKAYGIWVDVEITATTFVSGDHSTAKHVVRLGVAQSDAPYANSPFGY